MKIKIFILLALLSLSFSTYGQELQVLYDFRHSIDPQLNEKNFPRVDFKYFKEIDTVNTGAFLFEMQSFLNGENINIGQTFIQLSQSLKFWKPNLFAYFYYSGGVGVTPDSYGYHISNAYSIGGSYLLAFNKIWFNVSLLYRYSALELPSHDPQLNFYVGGAVFNYKVTYSSTLVLFSNNIDDGSPDNFGKKGKKVLFFADPQIWFRIAGGFSIGSKGNLTYHIVDNENRVVLYPAIGIKKDFY